MNKYIANFNLKIVIIALIFNAAVSIYGMPYDKSFIIVQGYERSSDSAKKDNVNKRKYGISKKINVYLLNFIQKSDSLRIAFVDRFRKYLLDSLERMDELQWIIIRDQECANRAIGDAQIRFNKIQEKKYINELIDQLNCYPLSYIMYGCMTYRNDEYRLDFNVYIVGRTYSRKPYTKLFPFNKESDYYERVNNQVIKFIKEQLNKQ